MTLQAHTDLAFGDIPQNHGCFAQMGQEGDIKYTWDPNNPEEVEAARSHFNDLKAKGFLIFKMKRWSRNEQVEDFDPRQGRLMFQAPEDTDGELAEDFDPNDRRYIATPQMQGG
jgi:hypothetical protein